MHRLSSNYTLFWKLFLPVFYITFFGLLVLTSFMADEGDLPLLTSPISRLILTSCYIIFVTLMYFTIINLKRVEEDDQYYYVTNYFKTYRYLKDDVEKIRTFDLGFLKWNTMVMRQKTAFGKRIYFIGDRAIFKK